MPLISKYRRKRIESEKKRAFKLYKTGLSLRDVAKVVGKSHVWVGTAVKELEELSTG